MSQNFYILSSLAVVFILLLYLTDVGSSDIQPGFPCDGIPNFCDRISCVPPDKCTQGIIGKGGGNCGCCDVCITYQGEGELCDSVGTEPATVPPGVVAQYYHYTNTCHPGLVCTNSACAQPQAKDPDCKTCAFQFFDHAVHEWEGTPNCNSYGTYNSKTCKGSTTKRCFCVNERGDTIFGRLPSGSGNATCACSRVVYEHQETSPATPFIRCTETGDFTPLQCWGFVCFCVDPFTRLVTSSAVPISGIKALPCWDSKLYDATFYTVCTIEYLKMTAIVETFSLKGMTIDVMDYPTCDPDGTYGFVQWDSNKYYCSDRLGQQIASYYTTSYNDHLNMICNCARDEKYPDNLPDNNIRSRSCNSLGNYYDMYCTQNKCYCLDSDGQQSSDSFTYTTNYDCISKIPPNTVDLSTVCPNDK